MDFSSLSNMNINNIINTMNSQQICDADCQSKKNIKNLQTTYIKAQQNLNNAIPNLNRAKKNYLIASRGTQYYSNAQEKEYKKEAQKTVNIWNEEVNTKLKLIDNKLKYYNTQFIYYNNIKETLKFNKDKYDNLIDKIQQTKSKKNVDDRLATYYNNNTTIVNNVNYYLKIIYWILTVIVLIFFFSKSQYKNIIYWPFVILLFISPFIYQKLFNYVFIHFKHKKINNILFVFVILVTITFMSLYYFSHLPFKFKNIE